MIFLGDSTIAGMDGAWPESEPTIKFCTPLTAYVAGAVNLGVGAQTLSGVIAGTGNIDYAYAGHTIKTLAQHVADYACMVVLEAGINDSTIDDATFAAELDSAIDIVRAAGQVIVLQTPNAPTNARFASVAAKAQVMRDRATARSVPLIDVFNGVTASTPQGIHPDASGYQVIGNYVAARLHQLFPEIPMAASVTAQLKSLKTNGPMNSVIMEFYGAIATPLQPGATLLALELSSDTNKAALAMLLESGRNGAQVHVEGNDALVAGALEGVSLVKLSYAQA
jgi:lysophospholipase L1-like esterase